MWVESRDGKWMVNLDNVKKLEVAVKYRGQKNDAQDSVADGYAIRTEDTLLAVYPTEEVAKRALAYVEGELIASGYDVAKMPKYVEVKGGTA